MSSWIGDGDEGIADASGTVGRRQQILQALSTESLSEAELVCTLSVSRFAINRGVERLVGLGLVERSDGRFIATDASRVVLGTHDEAIRTMANVLGAVSVLDHLPESAEPPLSLFHEAITYTGDLSGMERHASLDLDINKVTELAGFSGPFLFSNRPKVHGQLTRLGNSVTFALSAESLDWLSNHYPDNPDAMVDAGVRVTVIGEGLTFGVVVMDRPTMASATLVVYDHMDAPGALIVSYESLTVT